MKRGERVHHTIGTAGNPLDIDGAKRGDRKEIRALENLHRRLHFVVELKFGGVFDTLVTAGTVGWRERGTQRTELWTTGRLEAETSRFEITTSCVVY